MDGQLEPMVLLSKHQMVERTGILLVQDLRLSDSEVFISLPPPMAMLPVTDKTLLKYGELTGTNEVTETLQFEIFPNPATSV